MGDHTHTFYGDERRADDKHWAALNVQFNQLHADVNEIKGALKDVAQALTKLALVEERQTQGAAAMERAFSAISKLDAKLEAISARVIELEKNEPNQTRVAQWVDRAAWGAVGLVAMYVAARLGLTG